MHIILTGSYCTPSLGSSREVPQLPSPHGALPRSKDSPLFKRALEGTHGGGPQNNCRLVWRITTSWRRSSKNPESHLQASTSQRVQVPIIEGLWSQRPLIIWFLEPECLKIGYLDPPGFHFLACSKKRFKRLNTRLVLDDS